MCADARRVFVGGKSCGEVGVGRVECVDFICVYIDVAGGGVGDGVVV